MEFGNIQSQQTLRRELGIFVSRHQSQKLVRIDLGLIHKPEKYLALVLLGGAAILWAWVGFSVPETGRKALSPVCNRKGPEEMGSNPYS